jgi:hypothetical protein
MALRSGTPVNLSSLQRDYSALPKIAAIKAQANQGIFDAIQSGLEKRKDNIEKAEKKTLNIKLLNQIIESDKKNQFVPAGVTAEELSKYVPIEETLKYAQAMGIANQGLKKERQLRKTAQRLASAIPGMDEKTMRQLSRSNPGLLIDLGIKAQQGTKPEYELVKVIDPDGTERTVRVNVGQGTYTDINQQATTPKSTQTFDLGGRPVSPVDPATGRPPATSVPTTKGSLESSPSLAEQNANVKAKRDLMSQDVTDIYKAQARTGVVDRAGIAKILTERYPGLSKVVVDGIIEKDLEKIRDKAIQKLQEMEQSFPDITKYVLSLAQIDPSKGQVQGSGFLGMTGKEYEASDFGDIEANPEFNVVLRAQPEILTILGVPKSTIADIMGLKSELPNELTTKTTYSVQEVPGGGLMTRN